MALNKTQLETQLLALFQDMRANERDEAYYAEQLSTILDTFIKTGTVNTTVPNIESGTATAYGTGTIS